MSAPAAKTNKGSWLFGPSIDLLLGCGVAYAIFFVWMAAAGDQLRAWVPLAAQPLLTLLFGGAHYGATLLRVYERREDRRKYAIFSVYITVALAMLFVWGLNSITVGSWIVTVYLTWSPWHYSGQNYGVALMFLRRRKVPISPLAKRFIYLTFLLSYGLVVLTLHGIDPEANYTPLTYRGTIYSFKSAGIPTDIAAPISWAVCAAYLFCLVGATVLLKRGARWRDLGPTSVLVLTQALWFLMPSMSRQWGWIGSIDPFDPTHAAYTFMWVAMGHFIQYLWITAYYAAEAGQARNHLHFLGKALLAGVALWTVPLLVFAPDLLGRLPSDMGLALMSASVVNLHHFVLDGAIWKLRDGPVARVLLKSGTEDTSGPSLAGRLTPRWLTHAAWIAGVLVFSLALATRFEGRALRKAAEEGNYPRMVSAVKNLKRLRTESPKYHNSLARMALRQQDLAEAERQIRQSLELYETADAYVVLGQVWEQNQQRNRAIEAYQSALELEPEHATATYRSGRIWLDLGYAEKALPLLEKAAARAPDDKILRHHLNRALEQVSGSKPSAP